MTFDLKNHITENNAARDKGILNEAAGTLSDNEKKLLAAVKLIAAIKMTQGQREEIYKILRAVRKTLGK